MEKCLFLNFLFPNVQTKGEKMELNLKNKNRKCKVSIYTPDEIPPEKKAMEELENLLELEETIERMCSIGQGKSAGDISLKKIIVTPDFHKGAGIPIGTVMMTKGFVVPQAMGNDINCGMRLYTTDIKEDKIRKCFPSLISEIRRIFFEGGRNIPMNSIQREAVFKEGLTGLLETCRETKGRGIWTYYDEQLEEKQLSHVSFGGSLKADTAEGLENFIGTSKTPSYDDQIGSIGGGNHFVEMQRVAEIFDSQTANAWGVKKDSIVIMIHTGSLTIGHQSGMINKRITNSAYPKGIKHPKNQIYPLLEQEGLEDDWQRFWNTAFNAANFGFVNRLFLGLMLQNAVTSIAGPLEMKLLYDSPHNFIWRMNLDGENYYIHRKGACSAQGMEEMSNTPFAYYGEPVMIPGSMGSSSYLLKGAGSEETLWSASHGAGRRLSRGEAIRGNDKEFKAFMDKFHVITPIDPKRNDLKGRKDILKKWEESIRSEAPYAYKNIDQVIGVHEKLGMAGLVARMEPIFTIKS